MREHRVIGHGYDDRAATKCVVRVCLVCVGQLGTLYFYCLLASRVFMEDVPQEWASDFVWMCWLVCVVWPCCVGCKDGGWVRR